MDIYIYIYTNPINNSELSNVIYLLQNFGSNVNLISQRFTIDLI